MNAPIVRSDFGGDADGSSRRACEPVQAGPTGSRSPSLKRPESTERTAYGREEILGPSVFSPVSHTRLPTTRLWHTGAGAFRRDLGALRVPERRSSATTSPNRRRRRRRRLPPHASGARRRSSWRNRSGRARLNGNAPPPESETAFSRPILPEALHACHSSRRRF